MEVRLGLSVVSDDTSGDLELLRGWLRQEPELRGRVAADHTPGRGEMGTLLDAVTVAIAIGGALSVLAESLWAWFAQRRRSDVQVEIRHPDGLVIKVDAKRVSDVDAVLHGLVKPDGQE